MDTKTILDAVLVVFSLLILVALAASVISMLLGYAIRWLLERKQVQRLGTAINQGVRLWWNRHEAAVERWLEFGWEALVNPLFFGFVVYVLFNRITSITDYVSTHPEISLWQQLNVDVEQDVNFYMWILIVFTIWMLGKAWIHGKQKYVERTITKALEANTKVLAAIAKQIGVPESEYEVIDNKKQDAKVGEVKDDQKGNPHGKE